MYNSSCVASELLHVYVLRAEALSKTAVRAWCVMRALMTKATACPAESCCRSNTDTVISVHCGARA
eukprot:14635-Heterococcus_DN1.PRE.3